MVLLSTWDNYAIQGSRDRRDRDYAMQGSRDRRDSDYAIQGSRDRRDRDYAIQGSRDRSTSRTLTRASALEVMTWVECGLSCMMVSVESIVTMRPSPSSSSLASLMPAAVRASSSASASSEPYGSTGAFSGLFSTILLLRSLASALLSSS